MPGCSIVVASSPAPRRRPTPARSHAGNYKDGALLPGTRDCDYNLQFEERRCRLELRLKLDTCGGALNVSYEWGAPLLDAVCGQAARGRLALYSVGNHPLSSARPKCPKSPAGPVAQHKRGGGQRLRRPTVGLLCAGAMQRSRWVYCFSSRSQV